MSTPNLRGLAKAYSAGLLDRKRYIHERRQLIDDIVSGEAEIVPYESPPRKPNPDLERTFSDGETTLELPLLTDPDPVPEPEAGNSKRLVVAIAVVALAVLAALAWFKMGPQSEPVKIAQPHPPAAQAAPRPNPAGQLLRAFLDENRWHDESIDAFMLAWSSTPASDRAALAGSPEIQRGADIIQQKFLEESALFELGEETEALATQRRLLDLAAMLQITNDGLTRLENEWRENQSELHASVDAAPTSPPADVAGKLAVAPGDTVATTETVETAAGTDELQTIPMALETSPAEITTAPAQESPAGPAPEDLPSEEDAQTVAPEPPQPAETVSAAVPEPGPSATEAGSAGPAEPDAVDPPSPAVVAPVPVKASRATQTGCRAALAKQRRPYCRDALNEKLNGPALVVLPAGSIEIGGSKPEEQPRHRITVGQPFALGIFEISYREFRAFCLATKRECPTQPWSDPDLPVVNVPWTLAREYTRWLTEMTGATYRLPSESEWEYAVRAGADTVYPFGDEILPTHARFSFRGTETVPLASKDRSVNRNGFRLYHMLGNVREWVLDTWHEDHTGAPDDTSARTGTSDQRVVRGGSFADGSDRIRSASRMHLAADAADGQTGFRVVRQVD